MNHVSSISSSIATPAVPPVKGRGTGTTYVWIALAALLVAVSNGGLLALQRSITPAPRPLRQSLEGQPFKLGRWKGTAVPSTRESDAAVGAEQMINRQYELDGELVYVHCAAWSSLEEWTPHHPDGCYRDAGWEVVRAWTESLPAHSEIPIALRTFERAGNRVTVAFWYQIGKQVYFDRNGGRVVHRALWGAREHPPLVKTLLQTSSYDVDAKKLLELAQLHYERNCGL
jgi:Protein of unknown function (DUF3485)